MLRPFFLRRRPESMVETRVGQLPRSFDPSRLDWHKYPTPGDLEKGVRLVGVARRETDR